MKDIKEVYPITEYGSMDNYDYGPLLESFGYDILVRVDDDDYQGDSRLLFKDGQRFGLMTFGWGSCSGCDALQDCDTQAEVDELRSFLHASIHWEPSAKAMLKHISEKDWELEWCYHTEEHSTYLAKCIMALGGAK